MRTYQRVCIGILVLIALWVFFGQDEYVRLQFAEITLQSILSVLTPLLVISLFLERALEVFIGVKREPKRGELARTMDAAKGIEKTKCEQALADYKSATGTVAFYAAVLGGLLISVAGVRCLWPLLEPSSLIPNPTQFSLFNTMDVILTAGLLAGGSEGIHRIMGVITDWLAKKRTDQ